MELAWEWLLSRDWVLTSEFIRNIATAIAAIVGLVAFWRWQRELLGKDRYDLAKKISVQVNSLVNQISWGEQRRLAFTKMAMGTPNGYGTISSMINSKDYEPDTPSLWNELSELQSIMWQSSLLDMPDGKEELNKISNAYFEIFGFEISLQRTINESKDQSEAIPKLNELITKLEDSMKTIRAAKDKILEYEKPYILFKKSKQFSFFPKVRKN